eukprot:TRINITY_DN9016_c0_g1_i1.p2 TRINITY_DN9016_c0_g1~~TRINITY_DN9016_c0_g1_i1.p2  ORF type:complete len:921 (-),score=201.19 TRINITY_DN9016_c0_g1_i1:9-2771(-)
MAQDTNSSADDADPHITLAHIRCTEPVDAGRSDDLEKRASRPPGRGWHVNFVYTLHAAQSNGRKWLLALRLVARDQTAALFEKKKQMAKDAAAATLAGDLWLEAHGEEVGRDVFLVFEESRSLISCYEPESQEPFATIALSSVESVHEVDVPPPAGRPAGSFFEIVTAPRVYRLCAPDVSQRDVWVSVISARIRVLRHRDSQEVAATKGGVSPIAREQHQRRRSYQPDPEELVLVNETHVKVIARNVTARAMGSPSLPPATLLSSHSNSSTDSSDQPPTSDARRDPSIAPNLGSLLRLFNSQWFDMWIAIAYLHRHPSQGVHDYIVNRLFTFPTHDLEFFIPQLCNVMLHKHSDALQAFIIARCAQSLHFAIKAYLFLRAASLDLALPTGNPELLARCEHTMNCCKLAAVTGQERVLFADDKYSVRRSFEASAPGNMNGGASAASTASAASVPAVSAAASAPRTPRSSTTPPLTPTSPSAAAAAATQYRPPASLRLDQLSVSVEEQDARSKYFSGVARFLSALTDISGDLRAVPRDLRQSELMKRLEPINLTLPQLVYVPHRRGSALTSLTHSLVLRVVPAEAFTLSSAVKVPFMLFLEVAPGPRFNETHTFVTPTHTPPTNPPKLPEKDGAFGEKWKKREERLRRVSPFGHVTGWELYCCIVKNGDDLRQDQLAIQLIDQFSSIFQEAKLPLFLRTYRILITAPDAGLMETVVDSVSLDSLKKKTPNYTSLTKYFADTFKPPHELTYDAAVRNFLESLAATSLVCYLLAIKDRHNGNILLTRDGHLVHIDFGFMLSNSPGSINFESAPFKLTTEFAEVLGGVDSFLFKELKQLFFQGLKAARKHMDSIVVLVEMAMAMTSLPCLRGGPPLLQALKKRFCPSLTDAELREHVDSLFFLAFDNFSTKTYDSFQYYSNGILP